MSVPCKFERSLLSHDEYETIRLTHHPAIYDVEPAELWPYDPACARCAPRSKHLADKGNVKHAGNAGPAVQVFPELPSAHHNASRSSPLG